MDLNFIISYIIGIVIGTLLFLPIFYYISKLINKPILTINVQGIQIPINGFIDLVFWKITYPIISKKYNINKLSEKTLTLTGLEKLKLQFELSEILFKKIPLINSLIYLAIVTSIFWTIYLVISKTLNNTFGYFLGSFTIFILNTIIQIRMIKKKRKSLII